MKNEEMAENSYLRYFGGLALHYTINLGLRPFDSISTIGTVGIMICYDMGFPETARFLTLQGAEIIFCPSAWRSEDKRYMEFKYSAKSFGKYRFSGGSQSFWTGRR
jgi:hypothetical protein